MKDYADLEISLHRWDAERYRIEVRFVRPDSDTEERLARDGPMYVQFDRPHLRKLIIDQAPGINGLYIGAGFSGTGYKISPAVGIALAELATQGTATTVDISPFQATRFAEGRLLQGRLEPSSVR